METSTSEMIVQSNLQKSQEHLVVVKLLTLTVTGFSFPTIKQDDIVLSPTLA